MDNTALLSGQVLSIPVFSHRIHGANLYECAIGVKRLSGVVDRIVLLLPEAFIPQMVGQVTVRGQLRGYTRQDEDKRHLLLMVLVRAVDQETPEDNNVIQLRGELVREVYYRKTPLGREIADLMLKVPRPYSGVDYIPCVVWGRCARFCSHLNKGARLSVTGRMQSREYVKQVGETEEKRTAYELSIGKLTVLDESHDERAETARTAPDP